MRRGAAARLVQVSLRLLEDRKPVTMDYWILSGSVKDAGIPAAARVIVVRSQPAAVWSADMQVGLSIAAAEKVTEIAIPVPALTVAGTMKLFLEPTQTTL
jgi:hypothetical protein